MSFGNFSTRAHLWYAGNGPRWLAFAFARIHPGIDSLARAGDCWHLDTNWGSFYLSDPRQVTRFVGVGTGMRERVLRKYSVPGFVEVESGDTVVDVGAFIGEFSRPAGELGQRVVAVEPDDRNVAALRRNLEHLPESEIVPKAAWRNTGERSFQTARDPSEGSILNVDTDEVAEVITREVIRIDDLAEELGLETVDYLKIEAEGAEPEVLAGTEALDVPKIAVECAPERDGESPMAAVHEWLRERGYEIRTRDHIVFASR